MAKKSKIPKFVLVVADDWEAFYVDGDCVDQSHHVDLVGNLSNHGVLIESFDAYNDPGLEDGNFSKKLSDVKLD